ncbi:helix-turn-helix transcriptional regulator [Rhodopirellula sallentina]|uniref:Helix-turn-helix domain-containing protein n=1 Tax=Rhodopirellula sallentina SM41 TaxID=1263870 RepID=M5U075_9BACT|nr:hypothetical protein RSSM_03800 [Rhodopirellula sallentina SM41]
MLSVDDIAKGFLGCSPRHVRRLVDSGAMPKPIRLGSLLRWPRGQIEQWIQEGCPNSRGGQR